MSTGGPLVCLFGPYFFQNEYSKPLPGPKFEYWPFESIPLDIIMRVYFYQKERQKKTVARPAVQLCPDVIHAPRQAKHPGLFQVQGGK